MYLFVYIFEKKKKKENEVTQSCLILCDPVECSLLDFSIHGIFQARVLDSVAISFSRGSSQPRYRTQVSHIADDALPSEPQEMQTYIFEVHIKQENSSENLHLNLQQQFHIWISTRMSSLQLTFFFLTFLSGRGKWSSRNSPKVTKSFSLNSFISRIFVFSSLKILERFYFN